MHKLLGAGRGGASTHFAVNLNPVLNLNLPKTCLKCVIFWKKKKIEKLTQSFGLSSYTSVSSGGWNSAPLVRYSFILYCCSTILTCFPLSLCPKDSLQANFPACSPQHPGKAKYTKFNLLV